MGNIIVIMDITEKTKFEYSLLIINLLKGLIFLILLNVERLLYHHR